MLSEIHTSSLFKTQGWIGNEWVSAQNQATFDVFNPANGEKIAQVADLNEADLEKAIEMADACQKKWANTLAQDRAKILKKWNQLILDHLETLAKIMVLEQGKPYAEARGEIKYGASFVEWFAEEARRAYGDLIPSFGRGRRVLVMKQPVGIVGAITPWNFPHAMITRKCAPALAAGCPVIVKPAEDTPLSALALAELGHQAGFPKGVFQVIPSSRTHAAIIGKRLCEDPRVRKIGFTGSTEVGKVLMAQAASTVKRISLELGGNAPLIVFEDADLKKALKGIIGSKFRNAGQTCICSNRIFVHQSRLEEIIHGLRESIKRMKMGSGMDKGVSIGPLIYERALTKIKHLVDDARQKGAKIEEGGISDGIAPEDQNRYCKPTLVYPVSVDMDLFHTEIFGPVVSLIPFNTEEEVIRLANETPYGLAAYFFTQDSSRIWRVSEQLDYGMVAVNDGALSSAVAPFGGVKESGIGREGSKYGLDEFMETKYVMMGGIEETI